MLENHDKFWAFIALLFSVMTLAWLSNGATNFVLVDGKPVSVMNGSILRDAMVGLIAVLGTAAQALFRQSETAKQMNDLLSRTVDKLGESTPPPPKPAKEVPKNVEEAANQVAEAAVTEAQDITGSESTSSDTSRGG